MQNNGSLSQSALRCALSDSTDGSRRQVEASALASATIDVVWADALYERAELDVHESRLRGKYPREPQSSEEGGKINITRQHKRLVCGRANKQQNPHVSFDYHLPFVCSSVTYHALAILAW